VQGLYHAVNFGLSDPSGFIVSSLRELNFHSAVIGIEAQLEYVWAASRITELKTVVPLALEIEDSSFCRIQFAYEFAISKKC
jgi:hypothetical protein